MTMLSYLARLILMALNTKHLKVLTTPKSSRLSESAFQSKVAKFLNSQDCFWFKVIRANKSGIPDIIVCKNGLFIAIELKKETGFASSIQKVQLKRIKKNKGLSFLLRPSNFEQFKVEFMALK